MDNKLDKTAEVLSKNVKNPIEYIKEDVLLPYLKRHLRRKLKYYAMVKHVLSKMCDVNEEMARIISKHSLMEIEDRITYIANKLVQYQTASYPYNTLLVLDDAAGSPLLKNGNSELCRLFTKTSLLSYLVQVLCTMRLLDQNRIQSNITIILIHIT